jgi:hypothetical protein
VIATALAGIMVLVFVEGGNAGNAWLCGFTAVFGGGIVVLGLAPDGRPLEPTRPIRSP